MVILYNNILVISIYNLEIINRRHMHIYVLVLYILLLFLLVSLLTMARGDMGETTTF
jgi:hypothetical protein